MDEVEAVIGRFVGFDPIVGETALQELVALGDAGEEALFSAARPYPVHRQHQRRWLRYVATRERTVLARVLAILANDTPVFDRYHAAFLLAGVPDTRTASRGVFHILESGIKHGGMPTEKFNSDYFFFSDVFEAWGNAGGSAATLYNLSSKSSYVWSKLKAFVFRAACSSFARISTEDAWTLERLVTLTWDKELFRLSEIATGPDDLVPPEAVDAGELWLQTYRLFTAWQRGGVADEILRRFGEHPHWRARAFGAGILAALGFRRIFAPTVEWFRREPVATVRSNLLSAIERTGTPESAAFLLECYEANPTEASEAAARGVWRADDVHRARRALLRISEASSTTFAESITSLARLKTPHPNLNHLLDSPNWYVRLHAALAYAYLEDSSVLPRLQKMQRETTNAQENNMLAAARAMLREPRGALNLHLALVSGAADTHEQGIDLARCKSHLQDAVLAGLAAGGEESRKYLEAWQAEIAPLDLIAQPVVLTPNQSCIRRSTPEPSGDKGSMEPLKVFLSYSHRNEKMTNNLREHLAPMEDDGLIEIWHDREIEAGADWEGEINRKLVRSDVILLLVSASFLKSDYCKKELRDALQKRETGKSVVVPVILRDCDWASTFNLPSYKAQALPRDNRPISGGNWPNQDKAFSEVARELRKLFERMRK